MKFSYLSTVSDKETFKINILLQCLNSKRLLVDHVEILEECLHDHSNTVDNSKCSGRTLVLTSCIPAAIALSLTRSRWIYPLTGIASILATFCGFKLVDRFRLRQKEKSLQRLVQSLEQFEVAVKKNLLLVNESAHIRSVLNEMEKLGSDADELAGNCIRCCVETIRKIHMSIRMLENDFALSEKWNALYLPMEALEDCELLSEEMIGKATGAKAIKDFYNIFAYVQSQYLTRLALSIVCGHNDVLSDQLLDFCSEIDQQRHKCMSFLNRITNSSQQKVARVPSSTLPPEISNLRTMSITLSMKLLSIVHRYNKLEEILEEVVQNHDKNELSTHLKSFEEPLEDIAGGLTASEEECQRLLVTLRKILNKESAVASVVDSKFQQSADTEQTSRDVEERCYSEQDVPTLRDEFFAVDGTEQPSDEELRRRSVGSIDDLDNLNSKIAKRHFKPVLKQLRERIEPIGVEFKAREKRALKDKGIEVEDVEQDECKKLTSYGSDLDDEETDERNNRKFQNSVRRYDEVRGFLAAKEQMNIFGLKPTASVVNEDVLE